MAYGSARYGKPPTSGGSTSYDWLYMTKARLQFPDLDILACDAYTATVKYQCGHTQDVPLRQLRSSLTCTTTRQCKFHVTVLQAEFPDVIVLKYESKKAVTVKGQCGCVWTTETGSLRKGQRCGSCATTGYSQGKPGWLYFMERPGEMQVGITNFPDRRLAQHARNGWQLIDLDGPHDGATIFSREKAIRTYLRDADLLIDGTLENWPTTSWEPSSLAVIERIAA